MALPYPNLLLELEKAGRDDATIRDTLAQYSGQPADAVAQWLDGSQPLPTHIAFFIGDRFFPSLTVEYIFGDPRQ